MYKEAKGGFEFKLNKKKLNKQYIVFVTKMSTDLNNLAKKLPQIAEYLNSKNYVIKLLS